MIHFPNAKINLGLHILSKRNDGFHNIETVFYPIGLSDVLEVVPAAQGQDFQYSQSGIDIKSRLEANLVYKAYTLLKQDFLLPKIKVHLHKIVPFGAGLGGGSSDAVSMLKLLNELCELGLSQEQMLGYARHLGSDCAFFVYNKPAFAWERGDRLEIRKLDLKGWKLVLVFPHIFGGTAEAYSGITPHKPDVSINGIIEQPVSDWRSMMKNDFEPGIFRSYPKIESIKNTLYKIGAEYASMSGSGSAVYGLFKQAPALADEFEDCFVWEEELG